jgi:ferric-dicitrate binding protein FerR (iron transport regulator)
VAKAKELVEAMTFQQQAEARASEEEFQEVFRRILATSGNASVSSDKQRRTLRKRWPVVVGFWRVAALLVFALGVSFLVWEKAEEPLQNTTSDSSQVFVTKQALPGQRLTVTLPDGSRVKLNAGSRLRYPARFAPETREAYLEGEAFFEVAHNSERPFTIHTSSLQVQVLGTSFNINAFENETVALLSGSVKLTMTDNPSVSMILRPQEAGVLSPQSGQITKRTITKQDTYWYEGVIHFEDASFEEVRKIIERWYGVSIQVQRAPKYGEGLHGHFESQSIKKVLEVLSHSAGFSYNITKQHIIIH